MTYLVGLDFETYASTDLLKHGLHRYISCPDFKPLLAAVVRQIGHTTQYYKEDLFDFVEDYEQEADRLVEVLGDATIVAHNAGFEQSVLQRMGIDIPSDRFVDSAVLARATGAAGKLEAAAPQLLGIDKLEVGFELIKLFSIPGQYQVEHHSMAFNPKIRVDHMDEWLKFAHYCAVDAELSLRIALNYPISDTELTYNAITMDMNNTGWHVDLDAVRKMQDRYLENIAVTVDNFRIDTGAMDLNLSSHPQLVAWCAERGVRATSFDEKAVEKLLKSINKKLGSPLPEDKWTEYTDVRHLLETKQVLGGSSLKKLQVILDTVGDDGRLHDQYLHCGAGATYRTTGRGVQMQNLKRLNGEGDDMAELFDESAEWNNGKLASNLRQVFTATNPLGALIVGDFSSVESRGLAWQAGEQWKLAAYKQGQDLYKVQAAVMFGIIFPDDVTKAQRQIGKVAELACGYGAGADAVKDFAEKMGVDLSEVEAAKLVKDWRDANPATVKYWQSLDEILHHAVMGSHASVVIPHGRVQIEPFLAPQSLQDQVNNPSLLSLRVRLVLHDNTEVLERVIHGAHIVGRDILYWKPSERKTGDLWVDYFTNPKTKQTQKFKVYGGKLAGLLTQSLCREVFFFSLRDVHQKLAPFNELNLQLVGQFHDEIVLDWSPGPLSLKSAKNMLHDCMTTTILPGFPLAAAVKADYRYTK